MALSALLAKDCVPVLTQSSQFVAHLLCPRLLSDYIISTGNLPKTSMWLLICQKVLKQVRYGEIAFLSRCGTNCFYVERDDFLLVLFVLLAHLPEAAANWIALSRVIDKLSS